MSTWAAGHRIGDLFPGSDVIAVAWLVINCPQFTPSEETELLLPLLATLTQYGSVALTLPGSEVLPLVAIRTSK